MAESDTTPLKARRKETPPPGRAHILIVEDEQDLQDLLRYNLVRDGFQATCADTGEKALRIARAEHPDLIVLDIMLPGMDGLEVCRTLRSDPDTAGIPVVMLTAKSEEADVVTGLELGADDYIPKPFSPRVLIARVKAVLRRRSIDSDNAVADDAAVRIRNLEVHPDRHQVIVDGKSIELTATEFRLLHLLAGRPGRVFTRQQIIESIHGKFTAVTDRSVDVQVVMLRRKLGDVGADIQTVRGVGYRFRD